MSEEMAQALLEGQMAVSGGRTDVAQQWLGRAAALAPIGTTAQLVLAAAKLMRESDEAAELYAGVVKKHDLREAWLGLAAAHHLRSEAAARRCFSTHWHHRAVGSTCRGEADARKRRGG